jgi:hypothetical protein
MELSDLLTQCRVYTAEQSTIDLLPPKTPAIYAFYDLFRFACANVPDEIDKFKTQHARTIQLMHDDMPDRIAIKLRGNPNRFSGEGLRLWKQADAGRLTGICRSLMFLSLLNEPLYVGKTSDIKIRFRAHHDNDFLFKMKDARKRSPDEFLFFVFYCDEEDTRLIESILIQLINPPFCEQKT